ncbi:MAG: hypothetical protein HY901_19730 [Deltaproteobacteria bacterium]|nr:hypothetical protein [Deltaproteobacteria bacterium]
MPNQWIRAFVVVAALSIAGLPDAASAAGAPNKESKAPEKKGGQKDEAAYVCPMCPEIHQKTPGSCSKCGMDLVKKEEKKK